MTRSKEEIRKKMLHVRRMLSEERRLEAQHQVLQVLYPQLQTFSWILSFANKEEEINLWPLNSKLAKEGRLLFPRLVSPVELLPFAVKDFEHELVMNTHWKVLEPHPDRCPLVALNQIDCVLVPGIGFDANKQRIGYGKGHYDRFLSKLTCPFYGIGFKEQHLAAPLPAKAHDIPLTEVYLF
ncbi:MAG: 5-formyltetrahydrofolate cyclo-ligase [Simkaniaceae bacterium]|jgi:5-formyltetrahydrofolate cyclo-ligase